MSFIAAAILYHAGEVASFWLILTLMDSYSLKEIFTQDLPGLRKHESKIERLGTIYLTDVFKHFVKIYFPNINYRKNII